MALRVHVGGAESDSFTTVEEADTIVELLVDDPAQWDSLSTEEKELRLRLGAQLMGHLPLRGRTVFRNQRLCFPRTCQPEGQRTKIPADVKQAHVFISYSVVQRALAGRPAIDEGQLDRFGKPSRISLGGLVSVSFSGPGVTSGSLLDLLTRSMPFPVYQLLKPYLTQFRGSAIPSAGDADARTLLTTTTTISVTTTTV